MYDRAREALDAYSENHPQAPATAPLGTMRYGFELDVFRPHDRRTCREQLDLPEDAFIIMTSATVTNDPRKGGDLLAEAVRQLNLPDVLVITLGHVPAEATSGAQVRAMGYVRDPRRLALIYGAADIFVGPSREEAFGQVFVEAAACGTPSVGFAVGGVPEALLDGVTGILAAEVSAAALADVIARLYMDPRLRRRLAGWARVHVENEWSLENSYQRLFTFWREHGVLARVGHTPKIGFAPQIPELPPTQIVSGAALGWWVDSGIDPWEGPHPELRLPRCRWMTGPISRVRIRPRQAGVHRVRMKVSALVPAHLRVLYDGKIVADEPVAPVQEVSCVNLECDVDLPATPGVLELHHWPWNMLPGGRGESVLLCALDLLGPDGRRLGEVGEPAVESIVEGEPSASGAAAS
jgi:hypothetical protein